MNARQMDEVLVTNVVTNGTEYVGPDDKTTIYVYQAKTYESEAEAKKEAEKRGNGWRVTKMTVF